MSEVHLFHDPDAKPEEWRVEEIDSDGDGGIDMAIFSGPYAEQRAKQFAEQLRKGSGNTPAATRSASGSKPGTAAADPVAATPSVDTGSADADADLGPV